MILELLGFIAAVLVGITLGLTGSGGSILALPILVYLFDIPMIEATSYSLFIVGFTAVTGILKKRKAVDWSTVGKFGIPASFGVLFSRRLLIPALPSELDILGWMVDRNRLIELLFIVIMLLASRAMWKGRSEQRGHIPPVWGILFGFGVGLITGMVGAGGGFLIVPALILILGISVNQAVVTSLAIIAINSGVGFISDLFSKSFETRWDIVIPFVVLSFLGMQAGLILGKKINPDSLKKGMAIMIVVIALFMLF